jgi:type IV pilus biogenesis protein PilP
MQTESSRRPARRTQLAVSGFILALSLISVPSFHAAAATPVAAMPGMSAPPVMTAPAMASPAALPATGPLDMMDVPKPAAADGKNDKGFSAVQSKVPDSVKEVMKRLDNNNIVTLDDLNSARQAVARIEALIDIEKHISELEKIRSDREDGGSSKSSKSLASAIPASAIAPPPLFPTGGMAGGGNSASRNEANMAAMPAPAAVTDVSRIVGSNGHYSATIKTSDGQSKTYSTGDHLMSGGTIEKITSSEVVISQGTTKRVLHVKNVDVVFGNTP